jgi:hypothetical protein
MSDFILLLFLFFCFLNHFPSYYYSVCSIHGYQLSFPFLLGHVVDILLILFIFIWVWVSSFVFFFFFGGVWISIFPNVYYTYTTRRIRITPNKTMAATVYLILFFP